MENIGVLDAGIIALLGYAVVFFGIILLMIVVMIMGKIFVAADNKKKKAAAPAVVPAAPVAPVVPAAPAEAPGTAGELKLYDTPPKTAAMIMAIVADKTGKPLNELRFISIKEVKE
jgi:Na+-transporting methylmalonyl-CoA/oxaloacetate decarboxylase gamma subunit